MANESLKIPITGSAKQALVFANTPSFLMQRLQGDPMVQYAHQMLSPEALLEILHAWSHQDAETPELLLEPYAALLALSIVGTAHHWAEAKRIDLTNLPWASELYALADAKRAEIFMTYQAEPIQSLPTHSIESSWSAVELVVPKGVPA